MMAAASASVPAPVRAEFLGSGGEYFRIWMVNLGLTLVTLGIYSPWAKVRREQYFHRNTRLAGAAFDYDADPLSILRGRILALVLIVGLNGVGELSRAAGLLGSAVFLVAFPWMLTASLRFRLRHTLHRGLRFGFHGRTVDAARAYVLWPLAAVATLGFLYPTAVQRQQHFLFGESAFGASRFETTISVGAIYRICMAMSAIVAGIVLVAVAVQCSAFAQLAPQAPATCLPGATAVATLGAFLAALVVSGCYYQVRLRNVAWSALRLGPHRFRSDQTVPSYLALQLGNLLATIATLGLFRPWAAVRSVRYRAAHTQIIPGAGLDEFAAGAAETGGAAGDEISELFGFDVGF